MIQPADLKQESLPDRLQSLHAAQSKCCVNATNDVIPYRSFIRRQASLWRTTDRASASRQRSSIVRKVFLTGQVDVLSVFRIACSVSARMRPLSSRSNAEWTQPQERNSLGESGHSQFSTGSVSTVVEPAPAPLGKLIRDILATPTTEIGSSAEPANKSTGVRIVTLFGAALCKATTASLHMQLLPVSHHQKNWPIPG